MRMATKVSNKAKKKKAEMPVCRGSARAAVKHRLAILECINTPDKIQAYIDKLPYDPSDRYRSVCQAVKDGKAHCFAASLIAAYCLQRHGFGDAMLLEMEADEDLDDGHALAVYKYKGSWGSVAKSNFNGIRGRDPVYSSLRELVMSYFDFYVNKEGVKSLRAYSNPILLDRVDPKREWVYRADKPSGGEKILKAMVSCPNKVLPKSMRGRGTSSGSWLLAKMRGNTLKGQLLGSNKAGLH